MVKSSLKSKNVLLIYHNLESFLILRIINQWNQNLKVTVYSLGTTLHISTSFSNYTLSSKVLFYRLGLFSVLAILFSSDKVMNEFITLL